MAITQLQLSGVYGMRYGSFEGRAEFTPVIGMILIERISIDPGTRFVHSVYPSVSVSDAEVSTSDVLPMKVDQAYRGRE